MIQGTQLGVWQTKVVLVECALLCMNIRALAKFSNGFVRVHQKHFVGGTVLVIDGNYRYLVSTVLALECLSSCPDHTAVLSLLIIELRVIRSLHIS